MVIFWRWLLNRELGFPCVMHFKGVFTTVVQPPWLRVELSRFFMGVVSKSCGNMLGMSIRFLMSGNFCLHSNLSPPFLKKVHLYSFFSFKFPELILYLMSGQSNTVIQYSVGGGVLGVGYKMGFSSLSTMSSSHVWRGMFFCIL